MADTKISALPASTTPLAGTEVLPIVQSGATVKVAVSDLTAARVVSALGMTLTSTDAGATASPLLELYRDSASPAANDIIGEIEFNGEDSAGNKQAYGLIHASILSPTSTTEQGQLHFETATAGALTEKMIIGTTNLVINEIGAVFNVRIEGDTDANLFYTDATNNRIGVGTLTPAQKLDVVGSIKSTSGDVIIGTSGRGIIDSTAAVSLNFSSTEITANAPSVATLFRTASGSTSALNATATTIYTMPTLPNGLYVVQAALANNAPATFTAVSLIRQGNGTSAATALALATNMVITVSGLNIQATQTAGSTATISWTVFRIA